MLTPKRAFASKLIPSHCNSSLRLSRSDCTESKWLSISDLKPKKPIVLYSWNFKKWNPPWELSFNIMFSIILQNLYFYRLVYQYIKTNTWWTKPAWLRLFSFYTVQINKIVLYLRSITTVEKLVIVKIIQFAIAF